MSTQKFQQQPLLRVGGLILTDLFISQIGSFVPPHRSILSWRLGCFRCHELSGLRTAFRNKRCKQIELLIRYDEEVGRIYQPLIYAVRILHIRSVAITHHGTCRSGSSSSGHERCVVFSTAGSISWKAMKRMLVALLNPMFAAWPYLPNQH